MNCPLSFSPVALTSSVEETEGLFRNELVNSRILRADRQSSFAVEMNQVAVGGSTVSFIKHHAAYEIACGDIDAQGGVILGIGCCEPSSTSFNGQLINTLDNAVVISRHINVKHARTAGSCEIVLKSQEHDLKQKLQTNLDRPITRELQFVSNVSMLQGIGAQAKSALHYIVNSIDTDPTVLNNPLIAANYEDLLLSLILSMPNNYSDLLMCETGKSAAPATVVLAEEYMEANAHLPITIADVLAHVRCSRKSLYSNFRKSRLYTPSQFLINSRLRLAHQRLKNPDESDTVTSIAYDSGFSHLGRFSETYRRRYGVKPSETLRRF
jgi:AraC-like DNA-binding protein